MYDSYYPSYYNFQKRLKNVPMIIIIFKFNSKCTSCLDLSPSIIIQIMIHIPWYKMYKYLSNTFKLISYQSYIIITQLS